MGERPLWNVARKPPCSTILNVRAIVSDPLILKATGLLSPKQFAWEEHGSMLKLTWEHCGLKPFWALLFLSAKWRSWDMICKDFSSEPHMWWILNTSYLSTSLIISSFLSDKNSVIKENSTYQKQQMPSLGVMERIGLFWMACSALV